jgi:hypothetical protein
MRGSLSESADRLLEQGLISRAFEGGHANCAVCNGAEPAFFSEFLYARET